MKKILIRGMKLHIICTDEIAQAIKAHNGGSDPRIEILDEEPSVTDLSDVRPVGASLRDLMGVDTGDEATDRFIAQAGLGSPIDDDLRDLMRNPPTIYFEEPREYNGNWHHLNRPNNGHPSNPRKRR